MHRLLRLLREFAVAYRPSAGCSAVDAAALPRGGGCRRHRLDVSCFRVVNRNDSIPNPFVPFSRANGGARPSGGMMWAMPYAAANGVILEMYAIGLANSSGVGRNEGAGAHHSEGAPPRAPTVQRDAGKKGTRGRWSSRGSGTWGSRAWRRWRAGGGRVVGGAAAGAGAGAWQGGALGHQGWGWALP